MFAGFTDNHFDAYQQSKWRSKAFNLERMAVKECLLELGRELDGQMTGADGSSLSWEVSVEHPTLSNQRQVDSQQLYFARDPEMRSELDRIIDRSRGMASLLEDPSPQRSHVFLSVEIWVDHVLIGLKLHRDADIDRRNLEQQMGDPQQARSVIELLGSLPHEIHLDMNGRGTPAPQCSIEEVQQLLTSLTAPVPAGHSRWLTFGQRMDRAQAVALGSAIREPIASSLRSLLPLYQRIAWTRDNDYIAMCEQLEQHKLARQQRALEEQRAPGKQRVLVKSDRVRITSGIFAGRTGVIQEIDGKGLIKVLVGNIPVKLKADEVEKKR